MVVQGFLEVIAKNQMDLIDILSFTLTSARHVSRDFAGYA